MSVEHVEVLAEEPSMEAALETLLPKLLGPNITFAIHQFNGKSNLLRSLPARLRGYADWLPEQWRVVVLLDRDNDDCLAVKQSLEQIAADAGLTTKTAANGNRYQLVNRLAIEELEAWYFGDWQAVCAAYPRVPTNVPARAGYRQPDAIAGGTWEAFERLLKRSRYFKTGLRKIEAARAIAKHMDPARNTSPSFRAFRDALTAMTAMTA